MDKVERYNAILKRLDKALDDYRKAVRKEIRNGMRCEGCAYCDGPGR